MTEFYAQPYSASHTGFYFDSQEKYEAGMERLEEQGGEEVEIQLIDGDDAQYRIAESASISQIDIDMWFYQLEDLDDREADQLCYLLDCGYNLEDALEKYNEVQIWEGSAEDYVYDLLNETTDMSSMGWLQNYIDYESIARDMRLNSEIAEIRHGVWVTNASEF
ncbi:MAG: antirestriction protein ArdA [Candidatus Thiodiazotropha sp. (ex. Lucinisca nassula)]|nr:antirestriction protein ArdA [Candidatus Thiodiazotropha sp. (ex. Lucinisca nassula)]